MIRNYFCKARKTDVSFEILPYIKMKLTGKKAKLQYNLKQVSTENLGNNIDLKRKISHKYRQQNFRHYKC